MAARIRSAVEAGNNRATIIKVINTIAETNTGLLISLCKAIEDIITAIGITTKNKIIVKISI